MHNLETCFLTFKPIENKLAIFFKVIALLLLLITSSFTAYSQAFITTWITTDGKITIPTNSMIACNYNVVWTNLTNIGLGDGSATGQNGDYTISGLTNNNTYKIAISGSFPQFFMNDNTTEKAKIYSIEQWGIIIWTSMEYAFSGCNNLTYNATDAPILNSVTNLSFMFANATSFNGNIGSWNTGNITNMRGIFTGTSTFNQDVGNWNTSNVTNMSNMFSRASAFNQDISNWNTSKVTHMGAMFAEANSFNQNIGSWNTGNVINMEAMFGSNISFNQNIGNWNTSNVIDMSSMFAGATVFNQNIDNWDTGAVTDMHFMFSGASAFNQNIGNWNTSNVIDMSAMFASASAFNQNIGNWNTSNVIDMSAMFASASAFNQDIGNWNTSNVIYMGYMFFYAIAFNQNIDNWNTSKVKYMSSMFYSASSFNQAIGNWNINKVLDMDRMLSFSNLDINNYDNTLIGWAAQSVKPNVPLGADGLQYCYGLNAHNILTSAPNNWTITGDALGNCVALPITLLHFEGKRIDNQFVILIWQTANELNNQGFEIEQSIDNQSFSKIGFVDGAGNSNRVMSYEFRVMNGNASYYRLKQVDRDGRFNYSASVYIRGNEVNNFILYPNPATETLNMELNGKQTSNEMINLRVYNAQGNQIWTKTSTLTEMQSLLNNHFKTWKAGLYLIQIQTKEGVKQGKLVKY